MSRIGRKPIAIPAGVDFKFADGVATVKGPKGTLTQKVHPNMAVTVEGNEVLVTRPDDASIRASERMMTKAGIGMEERRLVVNRATAQRVRKKAQYDAKTVEMTLDCPLAGCIPEDDSVAACSQKGRIALECDGPARRALAQLTDALLDEAK